MYLGRAAHLAPLVLHPGDAPGPVQSAVCPEETVPGVRGPVVIPHQLNDLHPDNLRLLLGPHRPRGAYVTPLVGSEDEDTSSTWNIFRKGRQCEE